MPRSAERFITHPGKRGIDDGGQGSSRGVVSLVKTEIAGRVTNAITECGIGPGQITSDPFGVGVEQNFVGIKP